MRMTGAWVALVACAAACLPYSVFAADTDGMTARDIVARCDYKYPGDTQKTTLTITLRDSNGNEKKEVFHRYWKDDKGKDNIADKMVLFTEYPPDAKGDAFMRWGYLAGDKNADQWVYLTVLKKIRRVAVRDPGDSFLGSDLTQGDIGEHPLDANDYKLLQTLHRGKEDIYVVESVPKDKFDALYSKTVSWFAKEQDQSWDDCLKRQMSFYDKKDDPLKNEIIKWQHVDKAWVWDEVKVQNTQTGHASTFQVTDVKINVTIPDEMFTERSLQEGE